MPLVLQAINRCATNRYRDWEKKKKNLNEHFKLNGGDKDALDLPRARRSIPPYFSQAI